LAQGGSGVNFFFALSGFLITGTLLDTKGDSHYSRSFYVRRVLRIFPLYYLTLIVAFLALPQIMDLGVWEEHARRVQIWRWFYLIN
jgi:peptidoglycan/LPS O-acetylase OafA/YrhL